MNEEERQASYLAAFGAGVIIAFIIWGLAKS